MCREAERGEGRWRGWESGARELAMGKRKVLAGSRGRRWGRLEKGKEGRLREVWQGRAGSVGS